MDARILNLCDHTLRIRLVFAQANTHGLSTCAALVLDWRIGSHESQCLMTMK